MQRVWYGWEDGDVDPEFCDPYSACVEALRRCTDEFIWPDGTMDDVSFVRLFVVVEEDGEREKYEIGHLDLVNDGHDPDEGHDVCSIMFRRHDGASMTEDESRDRKTCAKFYDYIPPKPTPAPVVDRRQMEMFA